LVEAAAA
jgi:hypothetical protein